MADILSTIPTAQVGPAPQSGSGSIQDNDRPLDIGNSPSISVSDLRAQGPAKQKLNSFEKASAFTRAAQGASDALNAGKSVEQAAEAGAAANAYVRAKPLERASVPYVGSHHAENIPNPSPDADWADAQKVVDKQLSYKEGIGAVDMASAAYREMTSTGALTGLLLDSWHGQRDFQPDPLFDGLSDRELWGKGMPQADLEWVADAQSAEERLWKLTRLRETEENYRALGAHGEGMSTIVGLSAGILDPVGWAAGFGVGKVAQLAKVGVTLGNVSRAAAGAVEGAAGNVLATAAMQAAGDHVTPGDYFYAAAFGTVMGAGMTALHSRSGGTRREAGMESAPEDLSHADAANEGVQRAAEAMQENAVVFHAGVLKAAQERLPEGATPDMVAAEARNVYNERANAFFRQQNQPLGDMDRIMPDFDYEGLYGMKRDAAPKLDENGVEIPTTLDGPLTQELEGKFHAAEVRNAIGIRYNITPDTVPDTAKRLLMQETLARVERNIPVFDEAKLKTLVDSWVAPLADSKFVAAFSMPQHILARSDHPVMKWVAGNLLESPTQNAGPRATAAVEHALRERGHGSYIARYNEAYTAWRNQNGGSIVRDIFGKQKHYETFNRLVTEARNNRAQEINGNEHPHIAAAADAMDEGYDLLRRQQVEAKTLGSQNLPENSRGYTPRHLNARFLEENPLHREAIRKEIHEQLHEAWKEFRDGPRIAREVSAEYINRVRIEGAGGVSAPGHTSDPNAAPNIRDALAQHSLSEEDLDRYMKRISRGGGTQTKHRLDLDTTRELPLPDGSTFKMSDAFIQDQSALFRSQAKRVNGDVTLTRRGIFGKQGVDQLRELLVLSRQGSSDKKWAKELAAFDQTMAEFMGRPYGTANRILDNLRVVTGASRLGQAVIPQLAETASIASQLGTESAMRFVKDLPRLVTEVRKGQTNPLLHSLELPGGTIGDEFQYVVPWQSFDDIQLAGREATGVLDRAVRGAATAQSTLTGQRYLQAAQVRGTSEQIIHKVFKFAREGTEAKALRSMGINDKLLADIRADMGNVAQFDAKGNLTALDVRQSANPAAMAELVQAIERGAKQIIQGNFIGERQAYLHDSMWKLLAQFRSYSLTAMSKQWTRTRVDQGTAKAVGLLFGQMGFAVPIHLARVGAQALLMSDDRRDKYLEQQLRPDMIGRATLNYATLSGSLGDILDAGMSLGGVEMSGVKGGNTNVLGNIPALGYAASTAQALKDKDVSGIIKAMPGGNSLFLLPAVNFSHWMQKE